MSSKEEQIQNSSESQDNNSCQEQKDSVRQDWVRIMRRAFQFMTVVFILSLILGLLDVKGLFNKINTQGLNVTTGGSIVSWAMEISIPLFALFGVLPIARKRFAVVKPSNNK